MAKRTKKVKATKARKKTVKKGSEFSCSECGMVISVVDPCDCADPCDLVCCGEPMVACY